MQMRPVANDGLAPCEGDDEGEEGQWEGESEGRHLLHGRAAME